MSFPWMAKAHWIFSIVLHCNLKKLNTLILQKISISPDFDNTHKLYVLGLILSTFTDIYWLFTDYQTC